MTDALLSRLGPIAFALTGVLCGGIVIRYTLRVARAARRLEKEYRLSGVEWSYWQNVEFRKSLFLRPETILAGTDVAGIRAAKEELLEVRASMESVLLRGIVVLLAGFLLTVGASLLSSYLRHP